jgi:signal transduction histidine kinase
MTQAQPMEAPRSFLRRGLGLVRRQDAVQASEWARLAPLFAVVVGGAAAAVAISGWRLAHDLPSAETFAGVVALLAITTIAEAYPVPIEGVSAGRTSLASVFLVATAVLYGWELAAISAGTAMAAVEVANRRPPSRVLYNAALYVLAAAAAGLAGELVDGSGLARMVAATVLGWAAFYAVDITLVAAVTARVGGDAVAGAWRRYVASTALPAAILLSFAVVLVVLWDREPLLALALLCPIGVIALHERWLHAALSRLRELDRMRDDFMAIVSHELRTPVASVYGAAMTLRRTDLTDPMRQTLLGVIDRESARLAHLVDQVRWVSRLESADGATTERFDGAELARDVVESARTHLEPGITLDLGGAAAAPVEADAEKVRHVLANLVENAIKYSPEGGRISVAVEPTDSRVLFTVKDEGLGIPADQQLRIFEKFHRLDPQLTRGVAGTGLGLYISRELVRQMHGRIWVESAEGEGSTFSFELPGAAGSAGDVPSAGD